jgi:hypothetical protein
VSFQTLEGMTVRTRVARVNLLPDDFADARRERTLRLVLAAGVLVVGAACAGAAVVSAQHVSSAQQSLSAEQAKTAPLQAAQAPYADVPVVTAALAHAREVRSTVDANDVAWYSVLDQVAANSPDDLSLTALAFAVNTGPSTATTTPGADPLAVAGIGTMTVTGQTKSQSQVAGWLDGVATIKGIADPALTSSVLDPTTKVVTFSATGTLTDDILLSKQ